jgi:arginine utilization protein RocB
VKARFGIPQDIYDSFTKSPLFSDQEEFGRSIRIKYGERHSGNYWNMVYIRLHAEFPSNQETAIKGNQIESTVINNVLLKENISSTTSRRILIVFNSAAYEIEAQNLLDSIRKNAPHLVTDVIICISDQASADFAMKHDLQYFT